MFGLKRRLSGITNSAKKMEKKDLVEACIGGMVLLAFADGTCEDSEMAALNEIAGASDTFALHRADIPGMVDKYARLMKAGAIIGRTKIMKEIRDLKDASPEDREDAFACMVSMAMADGEVAPAERELLVKIGRELGVNPDSFLS